MNLEGLRDLSLSLRLSLSVCQFQDHLESWLEARVAARAQHVFFHAYSRRIQAELNQLAPLESLDVIPVQNARKEA